MLKIITIGYLTVAIESPMERIVMGRSVQLQLQSVCSSQVSASHDDTEPRPHHPPPPPVRSPGGGPGRHHQTGRAAPDPS